MDQSSHYCRFCGAALRGDSKFCENCGAPAAPAPSSSSALPSLHDPEVPQPQSKTSEPEVHTPSQPLPLHGIESNVKPAYRPKKANACLIVLGGIGIALICLSFLALGIDYMGTRQISRFLGLVYDPVIVTPEIVAQPTTVISPTLTSEPMAVLPSAEPTLFPSYMPLILTNDEESSVTDFSGYPTPELAELAPTQAQDSSNVEVEIFFDDFSTTQFGWAETSNDISEFSYANGAYSILVKQPSYISWSELPIEFFPNKIELDAIAAANHSGGSFGVMCHIQDEANYYSVEFDLDKEVFSISTIKDYTIYPMTSPEWLELKNLNTSEGSTNHYMVECFTNKIRVYVNGKKIGVGTFDGITPLPNQGIMSLFVATWEDVSSNGYQVLFDNVEAQIVK